MLSAPTLVDIAKTFDRFTEHFMGIGQPIRDNCFYHASGSHRFISRRNSVNGKVREGRFTMRIQIRGMVTQDVHTFVTRMLRSHTWLLWSGRFLSDPMRLLHPLTCECNNVEEAAAAWERFQASRRESQAPAPAAWTWSPTMQPLTTASVPADAAAASPPVEDAVAPSTTWQLGSSPTAVSQETLRRLLQAMDNAWETI